MVWLIFDIVVVGGANGLNVIAVVDLKKAKKRGSSDWLKGERPVTSLSKK